MNKTRTITMLLQGGAVTSMEYKDSLQHFLTHRLENQDWLCYVNTDNEEGIISTSQIVAVELTVE